MIAAILLAATISSPSIGEFMTLPSWMPRSVSASHTPGNSSARVSHRLDPNMAAAMAAVEEVLWERCYYVHGYAIPREYLAFGLGHSHWRAGLRSLFPEAPESDWYWYSYPTNRVAFPTRRISETNYLTTVLHMIPNASIMSQGAAYRNPLYLIDDMTAKDLQTGEIVWRRVNGFSWSSTLFGDPAQVFPAFDWTEVTNLVDVLSSWRGGRTLTSCTNSPVFNFFDDQYPVVDDIPPALLPYGIDDLTPPFVIGQESEMRAFYQAHKLQSPGTFDEVLSRAFRPPAPDYALLTNGTTRILYDRLAAANQVFAALDRTYISVWHDWNVEHSNAVYTVRQPVDVRLPSNAFSIGGDGEITIDGSKAIYGQPGRPLAQLEVEPYGAYYPEVSTGGANTKAADASPLHRAVYYRLNPTSFPQDALEYANEGTNTFRVALHFPYYNPAQRAWKVDADVIITSAADTNCISTVTISTYLPISDLINGSIDTADFSISVTTEGSLVYPAVVSTAPGLTFPAVDAFTSGRVAECEVAAIGEIYYYTTNDWGDVVASTELIKVDDDTVFDWSALYDFSYGKQLEYIEKLRLDFADKAGFYPQPAGLVGLVDMAHSENIDKLSSKMTFSAGTNVDTSFSPSGRLIYNNWRLENVIFDGSDILCGLVLTVEGSADIGQASPSYHNELRVHYLERVDWNWKALRLSNDNSL